MAINPPTTGDPQLDSFLSEITREIEALEGSVKPEDGWSLTDLEANVSEVIGDKRDLIDIVSKYDNFTPEIEAVEARIVEAEKKVFAVVPRLDELDQHSDLFFNVMEWWDQNYKIIEDAKTALEYLQSAEESAGQSQAAATTAESHRDDARAFRNTAQEHRDAARLALESTTAAATQAETNLAGIVSQADSDLTSFVDTATSEMASSNSEAKTDMVDYVTTAKSEVNAINDAAQSAIEGFVSTSKSELTAQIDAGIEQVVADGAHAATTSGAAETQKAKNEADRAKQEADRAESTALATTNTRLEEVIGGAPEELDTLREVATAIQDLGDDTEGLISSVSTKAEKAYVDAELAKRSNDGHTHTSADISNPTNKIGNTTNGGKVVKTLSTGWIDLPVDPTADNHPARKGYVDAELDKQTHTSADIRDAYHYMGTEALAGRLVKTYDNGHIYMRTDPPSADALARRAYVDNEVAKKSDEGHKHTSSDITDASYQIGDNNVPGRLVTAHPINGDIYRYGTHEPSNSAALVNRFYVDREVGKKSDEGHGHVITDVDGLQEAINDAAGAATWGELSGKPTAFPPEKHEHTSSDISDTVDHIHGGRAGRVVVVGDHGHIRDGNPPQNEYDLANKAYVDDQVSDKITKDDLPVLDIGYNVRYAEDGPADYPSGVSYAMSNANHYGWNDAISADISDYTYSGFALVMTMRNGNYTGSTTQMVFSYDNEHRPVYIRKWDHSVDAWGPFRSLTDDGHTHEVSDVIGLQSAIESKADKSYVDNNFIEAQYLYASGTGDTVMYRRSDGTSDVKAPTSASNIANKQYVDETVNDKFQVVTSPPTNPVAGVIYLVPEE